MADTPPYPDSGNDTGVGSDHETTVGTPRWVKVFGVIALAVVLLFVILLVTGRGGHGPSRHTLSGGVGGHAPPAGSHTQP